MTSKGTETNRIASTQIFDCESTEIPPGTKNQARLPRGLEVGTSPMQSWWLLGGAVVAALLIGMVIGRFWLS